MEHYDSEHTDDEAHVEKEPRPPSYEAHTPVALSPDLVSYLLINKMLFFLFHTKKLESLGLSYVHSFFSLSVYVIINV